MIIMRHPIKAVANTGCTISLIDKVYFRDILPDVKSIKITASINVRRLKNASHEANNYVLLNVFLNDISKGKSAREHIHKEFHLMKDLRCKTLLSVDILAAEQIIFNTADKIMITLTCKNLIVLIKIAFKPNARIKRVVYFKDQTLISSKSVVRMPIYLKRKKLFDDKNYLFESNQEQLTSILKDVGGFYAHICNINMTCVQVRNDRGIAVSIPRRARLRILTEYEAEGCYQLNNAYHEVVIMTDIKKIKT